MLKGKLIQECISYTGEETLQLKIHYNLFFILFPPSF